ncbi:MAG: T9SS type A sorting domain-containing protein [Bacteroidetes bacterium]|nr:T9SS type A sorting domain-containing protein [Bacteroidota bacterium]
MKRICLAVLFTAFLSSILSGQPVWTEVSTRDSIALDFSDNIKSMAIDSSGNVYVAINDPGSSLPGQCFVSKWNGHRWTQMQYNSRVTYIAIDKTGTLYGVGDTSFHYGDPRAYIGKWDGNSWVNVTASAPPILQTRSSLTALTSDSHGNLYAAGFIADSTYAIKRSFVIKWDGTVWTLLDTSAAILNSPINTLTIDRNGIVYAAGQIGDAADSGYVARWDGFVWSKVGTGSTRLGCNGQIYALTTDSSGNLYAAGQFHSATKYDVARWDGTHWANLGTGRGAFPKSTIITTLIFDDNGGLNAGGIIPQQWGPYNDGYNRMVRWNGTYWYEPDSGWGGLNAVGQLNSAGDISCMARDLSGKIYCAGKFISVFGHSYVATWDGVHWGDISPGSKSFSGYAGPIVTDTAGHIFASVYQAGTNPYARGARYFVAVWDGYKWDELGKGANGLHANSNITQLAWDASGNLYAVGSFSDSIGCWNGGCSQAGNFYVAKWDGTRWSQVGSRTNTFPGSSNVNQGTAQRITSMVIDKNSNIYIAGTIWDANGRKYVAKWDGNTWSELGTGSAALNANWTINTLALDRQGNVYAGGSFTTDSVSPNEGYYYIAKWDGHSWSRLGHLDTAGMGLITSVIVDGAGTVYAARSITSSGSSTASRVMAWHGQSWTYLGDSLTNGNAAPLVWISRDPSDNIYAVGTMSFNSPLGYHNASRWTDTGWVDFYTPVLAPIYTPLYVDGSGTAYTSVAQNLGIEHYGVFKMTGFATAAVDQDICIVSIDTAILKPVVTWEKANKYATRAYDIYRAPTPATNYALVGHIDRDSLSQWVDTTAHPDSMSYRYRIVVRDTCGMQDGFSPYHQTIYLSYADSGRFMWTPYVVEGGANPVSSYDLYCDSLGNGNWHLQNAYPNTQTTATISNFVADTNSRYMIVANLINVCHPTRDVTAIYSNILQHITESVDTTAIIDTTTIDTTTTGIALAAALQITIRPNPAHDHFIVSTNNVAQKDITITDLLGQIVYHDVIEKEMVTVDTREWPSGVYTCYIQTQTQIKKAKVVKR